MTLSLNKMKSSFTLVALLQLLFATNSYCADPGAGGELYATHCVNCHGGGGISSIPVVPSLIKRRDDPNWTMDAPEPLLQSDRVLLEQIKAGKNAMPAFRGVLDDMEILNIIAYLRTLQ